MMTTRAEIVRLMEAMLATHLPVGDRGLWYISRQDLRDFPPDLTRAELKRSKYLDYPSIAPVLTSLCRWTDATLHLGHGEAVMSDDPQELLRHLPALREARGRVLVTGLGLGCVVRGLLALPAVEHIDVVEISADVLAMVAPSFDGHSQARLCRRERRRLTIHHADALTIVWPIGTRWDFAWHDVWSDRPDTQVLHARLLVRYAPIVGRQGAWQFPRWLKRRWPRPLAGGARRAS